MAWQKIRAAVTPLFFCAVLCSGVMLLAFSCSHTQTNEDEGDEILADSGDPNEDITKNDQLSDLESSVIPSGNPEENSLDSLEDSIGSSGGSKSSSSGVYTGNARVPQIPGAALDVDGTKLNRFYFVRNGDTAESVAQLIFNNPAQAKDIMRWNPKAGWKAGSLLFYASPDSPSDNRMQSFYQERNVPVTKYTVAPGDWLSRIATKQLGSAHSWKEIAVVNGLESPDAIEKGQELALYPVDLRPYSSKGTSVASRGSESAASGSEASAQPPPVVEPPPDSGGPAEPPSLPGASTGDEGSDTQSGFNLSRALQDNMFAMGIGGVMLLLLVALLALNKKKRSSRRDDLGDELPAPKLKRK